jgi:hypothetical protein
MKKLFVSAMVGMCLLLCDSSVQAQFLPASSNAVFYFAQLADGGAPVQRWRSVFRIVNPVTITNQSATGTLWFFDPEGIPLPLDFGNGPVTSLQVTIPAKGAVQFRTAGVSGTLRTGSVVAQFDSPVQAVEEFQDWSNGAFAIAASVNGSGFAYEFETYADRNTGVAVANPSTSAIYCSGTLTDASGNALGVNTFALPGRGQTSFDIGVALNFSTASPGSYSVSCSGSPNPTPTSPPSPFVALTLAGNSYEITSSMPSGNYALPTNPYAMIWNAFYGLKKALNSTPGFGVGQPQLLIASDATSCGPNAGPINACFNPASNTVTVTLALVELLADSPSEVAFAIAHELGHAHQYVTGANQFYPTNAELDADEFSLFGLLLTGYDPYAAGGSLGKLMMALQMTSFNWQLWENQYDPHTSFPNRMGVIMSEIQTICALPQGLSLCQQEHALFHPDLPPSTPLLRVR